MQSRRILDDGQAGVRDDLGVGVGERFGHAAPSVAGERRQVPGDVDAAGSILADELGQQLLGLAVPHGQRRAELAQAGVEVGQALQQELRARRRGVAPVQQPVVEEEDWDHPALRGRGVQGRVIVHPQVASEPDDVGGGHAETLSGSRARAAQARRKDGA